MADYAGVESFYGGGGSSFEPSPDGPFVGYRLNPAQLGFSTNPTTGDQLSETMRGIRAGAKVIEVNLLRIGIQGGGDSDQVVPTQHFKEIRALSKLTGVSPSIHGPLVDAAGFSEQQGVWSEENREQNERIMFAAMEKAKLADPDKNIPVIFHSSNMLGGGTSYVPEKDENGNTIFKEEVVPVFNRATKQLTQVKGESEHYEFGSSKKDLKEIWTADESIQSQNATTWSNELKGLTQEKRYVDQAIELATGGARELENMSGGNPHKGLTKQQADAYEQEARDNLVKAQTLFQSNHSSFNSLFGQAYEFGTDKQKKELKEMSDAYREESEKLTEKTFEKAEENKLNRRGLGQQLVLSQSKLQDKYFEELIRITKSSRLDPELGAPKTVVRAEEFAMEQAAKSFGSVGFKSYKELGGEAAPKVSIENVWNGAFFSRGKDMKNLIKASRKEMEKNLVADGMDKDEAKRIAKKQIGMNFDVGHLNMFRKKGFETKDIVGEVKEFAPYINHMHITDNFGMSDEHLYPGQGNVPFKELLREVAKGHPDMDSFKKIVETGGVEARHMGGRSAHAFNLAAFGVPIFGGSHGAYTNAPNFTSGLDTFGSYFGGYGMTNPEIHHSFYGAGFSNLPPELGGSIPGVSNGTARSRFGGTPMS